ncbi:MAG: beta-lactamase family protein [Candidatus Coatesbacteria bacterium]|nr:beta-lactamase family protein [Candidatus Coatesbacteria bacterium]
MSQGRALEYFAELHTLVEAAIRDRLFHGSVFLAKRDSDWILHQAKGYMDVDSRQRPMDEEVIFDVASLTKVLVTAPSIMILRDAGLLDIEDRVVDYIPGFCEGLRSEVTVRDLLTHSSGLPAWAPLYLFADDRDDAIDFISQLPLESPPGEAIRYSCLGFIMLGKIIETVSGQNLDDFATERIFEPLGLQQTFFNPPDVLKNRVAPTEDGNRYEQEMAARYLDDFDEIAPDDGPLRERYERAKGRLDKMKRSGPIHGEVHDTNCHFLGGVSGNAGLFSCASDVIRMAEEYMPGASPKFGNTILSPASLHLMASPHCEADGQRRGLGWQLVEGTATSAGRVLSTNSFGHTGFTGCSLWIDPVRDLSIVLLSNAVSPSHGSQGMREFRPKFHDLVAKFSDCIFKPALV